MGRENGFTEQLACIDMASRDVAKTAAQLRKACVDSGFFYLINHGLDSKLLEEVFAQSKKFFALPLEEKMKVFCDKNHRGWTPFEEETLDPNSQSKGDSKEGYYIGVDVPEGDPRSKKPLHGPNQWPNPALSLPCMMKMIILYFVSQHSQRCYQDGGRPWNGIMLKPCKLSLDKLMRELRVEAHPSIFALTQPLQVCLHVTTMTKIRMMLKNSPNQSGRKLSRRVADFIALAVNLEEKYFDKPGLLDDPMAVIRLLHYSAEASNIEKGIYGTGAHSDYGMITLLATDDVPGLQICKRKDELPQVWEEVPPLKGAYIVNLGDMLERWTNGLFRSTLHRVINPGRERYSVPFFFEPNYDCVVTSLPTCCSEDNPPKYAPTTSGEHLLSKYRSTHQAFESNGKKESHSHPDKVSTATLGA